MNLPSLDDLTPEQWSVYDQPPDASLIVVGPPGSGKTSLAVHRARFLVSPELRRNVVTVHGLKGPKTPVAPDA
jgi:superfamily I DNA/RNA helicase